MNTEMRDRTPVLKFEEIFTTAPARATKNTTGVGHAVNFDIGCDSCDAGCDAGCDNGCDNGCDQGCDHTPGG